MYCMHGYVFKQACYTVVLKVKCPKLYVYYNLFPSSQDTAVNNAQKSVIILCHSEIIADLILYFGQKQNRILID